MSRSDQSVSPISAYVALGANLGDRLQNLQTALDRLARLDAIWVQRVSPVYETPAHTPDSSWKPPYLNAVAEITTSRAAADLLAACLEVERAGGRTRRERWGPRTIDLDLLIYGDERVDEEGLKVPHPRLADRRFVLQPLADLVPALLVPSPFNATVYSLLERTPDRGEARRYPQELAVP